MIPTRSAVFTLKIFLTSLVVLFCLLMQACTSTSTRQTNTQVVEISDQLSEQEGQIKSLRKEVVRLSNNLSEQYETICRVQQAEQSNKLKARNKQIKSLQSDYEKLKTACDDDQAAIASFENKLLLGEIENVTLVEEQTELSARIDTGAETSSLGVYKQTLFERDGKQWVRFSLQDTKNAPRYEYRVRGRIRIKQSAVLEGEERIEIRLAIKLGDKTYKRQTFNLSNRSYLEHQVLIGRSFLTDTAVVDTSAKYLLGR